MYIRSGLSECQRGSSEREQMVLRGAVTSEVAHDLRSHVDTGRLAVWVVWRSKGVVAETDNLCGATNLTRVVLRRWSAGEKTTKSGQFPMRSVEEKKAQTW